MQSVHADAGLDAEELLGPAIGLAAIGVAVVGRRIEVEPARRRRTQRHVWVEDGEFLKAVAVDMGLSDSRHTEVLSRELKEGQLLVTGVKPK